MKNKKLNLGELKVKSFVTEFENRKQNTIKGGFLSLFDCKGGSGHFCPNTEDECTGGGGGPVGSGICTEATACCD